MEEGFRLLTGCMLLLLLLLRLLRGILLFRLLRSCFFLFSR